MESFQLTLDLGMDTVCEKDWGAPDPISEEGIDRVSNLLRSGRLFRFCKKEKQKAHNLLVKFSSVSATVLRVNQQFPLSGTRVARTM